MGLFKSKDERRIEREMKIRYLSTARDRQDRLAAARPRPAAAGGALRRQAN